MIPFALPFRTVSVRTMRRTVRTETVRKRGRFEIIPGTMSKAVFPEKPAVRPLAGTDYVLEEEFYFPAQVGDWNVVVCVKPGFRTDGASIPRWLWIVFGSPYDPDIMAAAIGHDAMYRGRIVPRTDADAAFRRMMKDNGIGAWKRRRIWIGVRLFGWITYLRHTPESVAEARRHIQLAFATTADARQQENKKGKSKMKKLTMAIAAAAAIALTGCATKSRSFDAKGMYISDTGQLAVGVVHVDAIPDGADSAVIHYTEDTALLSPATKTHDIDIILTGTNSVGSANGIVKSICNAFVQVAPSIAKTEAEAPKGITVLDVIKPTEAVQLARVVGAKAFNSFVSGGGDAAKATVTTLSDGSMTISDENVCTTCTAGGECTTGACQDK